MYREVALKPSDADLDKVIAYFKAVLGLSNIVGRAIRQAFNEVIDGARTGRYKYGQLDKEEKTYIGKKVEIIVRAALGLPKGKICDLNVEGVEVDIKWSSSGHWMIPQENVGQICLVITATDTELKSTFSMGFVRADKAILSAGQNQDKKRTITSKGKKQIQWLFEDEPMPPNFLLQLPPIIRHKILSGNGGQTRVNELFRLVQRQPIPREALETIGNQRDTAKRVRDARKVLSPKKIKILSGRYDKKAAEAERLPTPAADEFISFTSDA